MRRFPVARLFRASLLTLVAVAGISARAQDLSAEQKAEIITALSDVISKRAFVPGVDFSKWPEFVESQKEAIDKADNVNSFSAALNGALRKFGFSHIRLATPRATSQRGQTSTIGVGMAVTKVEDGLRVRSVATAGPAKEAGIEVGDVIVKLNGEVADKPESLEGERGSKITVEVKKANGEVKTMELERKQYSTVRKETLTWVDDETAVLRVYTFSAGYGRENIETLMKEAAKAKQLVLDLRNNGGGAVSNLNHLLSLLLPDQTPYGVFVSRQVFDKYKAEKPDQPTDLVSIANWSTSKATTRKRPTVDPFPGRIAVLINRGSGSASEICAAAIKENGGILVGTRTAGAVLASTYARLPHGFSLQFPVSDYVTTKGMRLEANPLRPDAEVTEPATAEKDPVLVKATEMLRAASIGAGGGLRLF